jgi:hypothetical protein
MDIRQSPATAKNRAIQSDAATPDLTKAASQKVRAPRRGNAAWLEANATPGAVVLLGGAGLTDFRIRVAQGHLRTDMLPSFWSVVGIASTRGLLTVPLLPSGDASMVPATNAIRLLRFRDFDPIERFPNVAAIQFAERSEAILANADRLVRQRNVLDLPTMLLSWLGFVWGAGGKRNPLLENIGLPSAAFVETAFGMAGIELTPGLASGSSCPEAIWQSALWWHDYYKQSASTDPARLAKAPAAKGTELPRPIVPAGTYRILQPAAAVTDEGRSTRS